MMASPRSWSTVAALTLVVLAAGAGSARAGTHGSERYDAAFRKYSKRYFGAGFDWRLFKAQAMAESSLDPAASSGQGARGLMQLLPSTFADVRSSNPGWGSIDEPEWNIAAGICHDRELWNAWGDAAGPEHRERFTLGSYNAGRVTVQRAQKLARERELDEHVWPSIEAVAPSVPRWKYLETLNYLVRIRANLAGMDREGRVLSH
jgi:membrane-bound lytic murein transglycosylase MltF